MTRTRGPRLGWVWASAAPLCALGVALASCVDDGAVTLPANRNTLKSREILINPFTPVPAPADHVRPLDGMSGAPLALHPELPDVRLLYWRRPASASGAEPDGAHVERVSVGGDGLCALTLDGLFPGAGASPEAHGNYAFDTLDAHIESVLALGSAAPSWRPERAAPGGPCPRNADLDQPTVRAAVVANTLRHLTAGTSWDPDGHAWPVDLVELPLALVTPGATAGAPADAAATDEDLFAAWVALAQVVRQRLPADSAQPVAIGGPDLRLDDATATALTALPEGPPTRVAAFIAYCSAQSAPLDTLTYRTETDHAFGVRRISDALRARLDAAGLGATGLFVTAMVPARAAPWDAPDLLAARLGAFEMAARIFLQDLPVDAALSGRGPFAFSDGAAHAAEPLVDVADLLVPSAYFTLDGAPTPAFMARFPLRQISGQSRLRVIAGPDLADLAVLASRPSDAPGALRVIIADADVESGAGSLIWELRVPGFVPPAVGQVNFRLALLDQKNHTVPSFFFSELGTLTPDPRTGDVVLSRELPIPGVHYLELERPTAP